MKPSARALEIIEAVSLGEMTPDEAYSELDKLYAQAEGMEKFDVSMSFEAVKKYDDR